MKKNNILFVLIISIVVAIVSLLFVLFYVLSEEKGSRVCFDEVCFAVDVADDSLTRARGLMDVDYLDDDRGMLFVYEAEGSYSFWMKNTLIHLDIIWIDEEFEVVYIANAFPCVVRDCEVYSSFKEAKYILEINYGLSERYGIYVGDMVKID